MSTQLPYQFNPEQYDLPSTFAFIKQTGQYKVTVTGVELKATANNAQNAYLAVTFKIVEGDLAGQTFVDRLNLINSNPETAKIAHRQLAAYCTALGVRAAFDDARVLINGAVCQLFVEAVETTDSRDPNKKLWNNNVKNVYYADGSDLQYGKFGSATGQAQQQGGFAQAAPQAPVAPQAPQAPVAPAAPQPQAPQAPQVTTGVAYAPQPQAPQAQPQQVPPQAAQPSFAPPAQPQAPAFAAPSFAPPQA